MSVSLFYPRNSVQCDRFNIYTYIYIYIYIYNEGVRIAIFIVLGIGVVHPNSNQGRAFLHFP